MNLFGIPIIESRWVPQDVLIMADVSKFREALDSISRFIAQGIDDQFLAAITTRRIPTEEEWRAEWYVDPSAAWWER